MSDEQRKQLKEALKAELSPLLVGLRNEIKNLIVSVKETSETQKTEITNFPEPTKQVEITNQLDEIKISNPQKQVEIKGIKTQFANIGKLLKILVAKDKDVQRVEVTNHAKQEKVKFPTTIKVSNLPKQKEVQKVTIENSTPKQAIPVVLTGSDRKSFYNALSQIAGWGGSSGKSVNTENTVLNPINGGVTVGTVSTIITFANINRTDLEIVNDSNNEIYLSRGTPAVVGNGIRLNRKGGSYTINSTNLYRGNIYAIASTENNNVTVSEGN